jgi:translation initiation factor 2B subunit (eIF-2B alpha/beta/delta family)
MKQYKLPEQLVNAILQYLAKQPYLEVSQLISGIQSQAQELKETSPGVQSNEKNESQAV